MWIKKLRKDYSANNDIWNLCRAWESLKHKLLEQLNDGSYQFSALDRLEFDDGPLSLWSSRDMIALRLITQALGEHMQPYIPSSCTHVKGHGGLKKGVVDTRGTLSNYLYVLRSDIKSYYDSIRFETLQNILSDCGVPPKLCALIYRACLRVETGGAFFMSFPQKGCLKVRLSHPCLVPLLSCRWTVSWER